MRSPDGPFAELAAIWAAKFDARKSKQIPTRNRKPDPEVPPAFDSLRSRIKQRLSKSYYQKMSSFLKREVNETINRRGVKATSRLAVPVILAVTLVGGPAASSVLFSA